MGITPVHILEDSFDAPQTRQFEKLRLEFELPATHQVYGYGGYIVARTAGHPLTRDQVPGGVEVAPASGRVPTMKFANEAGGGKEKVFPGIRWSSGESRGPVPSGSSGSGAKRFPRATSC